MTTRTPRVGVTLSEEARDVVQRLAALQNTSASKVVAEIVEEFLPVARQLVELGESASNLDAAQRAKLQALAQSMEAGVLPKSNEALVAFQDALTSAQKIVNGS